MMKQAIVLNALICAFLVIGGVISCIFSYKENLGDRRFVFRAAVTWTFGLTAWFALWGLYSLDIFQWGKENTIAMLMSDINTASCFLFYVIVTRGQRKRVIDHVRDALPLLTLPAIATLSILAYDQWNPNQKVHTGLSLAYSMITPVIVGWALWLRFVVVLPLALGCVYAILQPPAYGALFNDHPNVVSEPTILVTITLAIAKVAWGSGVFYTLAREVKDTNNVIRSIDISRMVSRNQTILHYFQLLLGILLALGYLLSLRQESRNALASVAELVGIVLGILTIVYAILSYHKADVLYQSSGIRSQQNNQESSKRSKRPQTAKHKSR